MLSTSLLLLSLCGWVAFGQDSWQDGYWRSGSTGDAGFDGYMRKLFRRNACGYDSIQQRYREEGDTWEKGIVRYQCTNGQRTPIACLDSENSRWMRPGEQPSITRDGSFGRTCQLDAEGYMRLVASHCAMDGRTYRAGEDFEAMKDDCKYWYRCAATGNGAQVEIQIGGCVADNGQRLNVGEYYDDFSRNTWYYCEAKGKGVAFCKRGCLDGSERRDVGEQWADYRGSTMLCQRVNGRCDIVEISTVSTAQNRDPVQEETYWNQQNTASWNNDQTQTWNYNTQQTYSADRSNYCKFEEGGRLRFYLPYDTYYVTNSEEYLADVYVVCASNDYTRRYEAVKYQTSSYTVQDILRFHPTCTKARYDQIRYD